MNDDELIKEITRIIFTKYFNSSAPHIRKTLVPHKKPPWLAIQTNPPSIPEASIQENSFWSNSDILSLLLHSFFATLCYSLIAMRVISIIRKRRERNWRNSNFIFYTASYIIYFHTVSVNFNISEWQLKTYKLLKMRKLKKFSFTIFQVREFSKKPSKTCI